MGRRVMSVLFLVIGIIVLLLFGWQAGNWLAGGLLGAACLLAAVFVFLRDR